MGIQFRDVTQIMDVLFICLSLNRDSAFSGQSGKDIRDESRVELEEKFRAKYPAL